MTEHEKPPTQRVGPVGIPSMAFSLDPQPPTPLSFAFGAREFAQSASRLTPDVDPTATNAARYLASHAIELSLKAFLLAYDVPEERLRKRDLGHKLSALHDLAVEYGLSARLSLTREERGTLDMLSDQHDTQVFRYLTPGVRVLRGWPQVIGLTELYVAMAEQIAKDHANGTRPPPPAV